VPSLIETVRVRNGVAPLWYLHLRRLATSCKALGVPLPPELITPEGGSDRIHRLEVGSQGVKIGERPVGSTAPVALALAAVTHRAYPHKTTERAQFDRALEEARAAGADDAILLTAGGYVAECAVWSLFWWEDGRLCAPALELGVLPGVARARLEEMTQGLVQRKVRPAQLEGRSLFVANAARGVVPVARLEGREVAQDAGTTRVSGSFWP
jgi:branched-subunit amino acid aminotransferase/4-amino-4-deoxychorismate lyase